MRVLVTFGSRRGGTEGIARTVAESLRGEGILAELAPASEVRSIDGYDAVVVGGAVYAGRWHQAARRFVTRHLAELRRVPTYFFSSGPLDDSAAGSDVPPVAGVYVLMDRVGARGHVTFGGRLTPYARGFPASAMARERSGDWRDLARARRWAQSIAAQLRAEVR